MGQAILQAVVSTLATQTITGSGLLTATANFPSNTTPGSLIAMCIFTQSSSQTPTYGSVSITGGALTWNTRGSWSQIVSGGWKGTGVFSFIGNAASISSGTTISVSRTANAVGARTDNLQFILLEIGGADTSVGYLDGGGFDIGTASVPNPGPTFATANNEIFLTGFTGNTNLSTPPPGFTAGPALTGIGFGGLAYMLNAPSSATAVWGGVQAKWAAGAHTIFGQAASESSQTSLTFF